MRAFLLPLLLSGGLGVAWMGCSGPEVAEGCEYHSDCPDGSLCEDEECEEVECTSSEDCQPGYFCAARFECAPGCEDDTDCAAGESCNEQNQCAEYGCRTTELDCAYGEFCDQDLGECYEDDAPHCAECDINATNTQCGGEGDCFYLDGGSCTSDSDCEEGYSCDTVGFDRICHADICLVTCNPNAEEPCPRGYQCGDVTGLGDYYCFADCVWLRNEGYL